MRTSGERSRFSNSIAIRSSEWLTLQPRRWRYQPVPTCTRNLPSRCSGTWIDVFWTCATNCLQYRGQRWSTPLSEMPTVRQLGAFGWSAKRCDELRLTGSAGPNWMMVAEMKRLVMFCPFCRGSCVVSRERAEEFDEDNIPEKEWPHCRGTGTRGLVSDLCPYCKGDTIVSEDKFEKYDPDKIDEVACPHCDGVGTTGLVQDYCAYCRGSQVVTREKKKKYRREKLDEVECPHCHGAGVRGRGEHCEYWRG